MKYRLSKNDVVMTGGVLSAFEYGCVQAIADGRQAGDVSPLDREAMLERLRRNPMLAAELLSYEGHIVYMGAEAGREAPSGGRLGMRFSGRDEAVEGDNVYGRFLETVRDAYRRELAETDIIENDVRPGQVFVDYVPAGETVSFSESNPSVADRYIHTEPYTPSRFVFDASKDGTTGHAERSVARDERWKTFECPFGTGSRSKVRVGSDAEAALLYEMGIRGELDLTLGRDERGRSRLPQFLRDLQNRGLVKKMPSSEAADLVSDLSAQFAWMREKISRDRSLAGKTIVASSLVPADSSYGRSICDRELAPSPAHVLARYINNPLLLYSSSPNGVLRALSNDDKEENYRLSRVSSRGKVTIIVDGSDTIGGRVPGTRAVRRTVEGKGSNYVMEFKPQAEVKRDYEAFSARLRSMLANINPSASIEFVTGTGVGTPRMVQRFVQEEGGSVFDWNHYRSRSELSEKDSRGKSRFSVVRMPHFEDVVPVMLGYQRSVSFNMVEGDSSTEVTYRTFNDADKRVGVAPAAWFSFPVVADRNNAGILKRASLASAAGIAVINVQENRSEEEQSRVLEYESSLVRDAFQGEMSYAGSLLGEEPRRQWNLGSSVVNSVIWEDGRVAIPSISAVREGSVYVNDIAFHTVYGAYAAMVMKADGVTDSRAFRRLAASESSMSSVVEALEGCDVSLDVEERCMRNAVHLMAKSSMTFANELLDSGDAEIVEVSSFGGDTLFTDVDGNGSNLAGLALAAERESLRHNLEAQRIQEEAQSRQQAEDNIRLRKRADSVRARGEKMSGGLPVSLEEASRGVYFFGTDRPSHLVLPDDNFSFAHWIEQKDEGDKLDRETASRPMIADDGGAKIPNKMVFLFASDTLAVTGQRRVQNYPDSKDLTGLKRVNPDNGQEFVCAYGIPVKHDNRFFEKDNKLGRRCSFKTDAEGADFINSLVAVDSLARTTAIAQNMSLCYAIRENMLPGGEENDDIGRVFNPKVYDFERTNEIIDVRTGLTIQDAGNLVLDEDGKARRRWIPSPHAAPKLRSYLRRYQKMLVEGAHYPLNCICMPRTNYNGMTEEQFLADFSFALSIANSTALALDLPLRFPLDKDGHLWLGPDVPENLRVLAEKKIDAFIGVVQNQDILNNTLPEVYRIPISQSVRQDAPLRGDGSDFWMRPNDLLRTFGPYDFRFIEGGQVAPIHEMSFFMDGNVFRVTDPRLTTKMNLGEINRYLRYDKNDECRWTVRSDNPERIGDFVKVLKSYVERSRHVQVETRLVPETQAQQFGIDAENDSSLEGFVSLRSSNAEQSTIAAGDVSARGPVSAIDAPNRFDGSDNDGVYYGREEARDAFFGWVQMRYTLPDGTVSDWVKVRDRELATDVVMSSINRVYRSDTRVLPSKAVLNAELVSVAITEAGESFRSVSQQVKEVVTDDKIVISERYEAPGSSASVAESVQESSQKTSEPVYISYYGSKNIPEDALVVQVASSCPEGFDVDILFETVYPDYRSMIEPHRNGKMTDAEFEHIYREKVLVPNKARILDAVERMKTISEGRPVYLVGYERPGDFSHRYILSRFLNENGLECVECPGDAKRYVRKMSLVNTFASTTQAGTVNIFSSTGENANLSNFAVRSFTFEDSRFGKIRFKSVEQAFQYMKTYYSGADENVLDTLRKNILSTVSGGQLRELGRSIPALNVTEWNFISADLMYDLVKASFHTKASRNALLATGDALITHSQDSSKWGKLFPEILMKVRSEISQECLANGNPSLTVTVSEGNYGQRTRENANADDVDFTFQFAVDFETYGEKSTARAAGDSIVSIPLPVDDKGLSLNEKAVSDVVNLIIESIPEEYVNGEPFGVNVAGNGIYTLNKSGITQEQVDVFLSAVFLSLKDKGLEISSLRSGGQTGVDEAVVAAGRALGVDTTVHAPAGYRFRGVDGKDVYADRESFIKRFDKNYSSIIDKAVKVSGMKMPSSRKEKSTVSKSL